MVDAQHAHLRAAPGACGFHRGARCIKHINEGAGAGCIGVGAPHQCAAWAQIGKVIAHAAAAPHGFGRLRQRGVNAGVALGIKAVGGIGYGLHKAVDQRGLGIQPCSSHDAPRTNGAALQIVQKLLLPVRLQLGLFHSGQRLRDARKQVLLGLLACGQVFFGQYILADGLRGKIRHGMPHATFIQAL